MESDRNKYNFFWGVGLGSHGCHYTFSTVYEQREVILNITIYSKLFPLIFVLSNHYWFTGVIGTITRHVYTECLYVEKSDIRDNVSCESESVSPDKILANFLGSSPLNCFHFWIISRCKLQMFGICFVTFIYS